MTKKLKEVIIDIKELLYSAVCKLHFTKTDIALLGIFLGVFGTLILAEWPIPVTKDIKYENKTYSDENPFKLKNDILRKHKNTFGIALTVVGSLLGGIGYFTTLKTPTVRPISKLITLLVTTFILYFFLIKMVEQKAKADYLPKIKFSQADLFFKIKYIIENNGLHPDELDKRILGVGVDEITKVNRLEDASENLDILGKLLDYPRKIEEDSSYFLKNLNLFFAELELPNWYFVYPIFDPNRKILRVIVSQDDTSENLQNLPPDVDFFEASTKLQNLPDEVIFPDTLKDKIRYDQKRELLISNGVMSETEKDELLRLSTNIWYKFGVEELFRKSQSSLHDKIRYDKNRKVLIFKGVMLPVEKNELLERSKDDYYREAIEALFQKSWKSILNLANYFVKKHKDYNLTIDIWDSYRAMERAPRIYVPYKDEGLRGGSGFAAPYELPGLPPIKDVVIGESPNHLVHIETVDHDHKIYSNKSLE